MNTYPFNALVSRMKYIRRWSLMHSARPETLSEHTTETAILAHTPKRWLWQPSTTTPKKFSPGICPPR